MELNDAIKNRRSVRKYLDKPVPMNLLMELIGTARQAPSGNNA